MPSSSQKHKMMKKSSRLSIPDATDKISNLPDSILCHILSFLPTKHAATTSVLSKRWTSMWLSVLSLHLNSDGFTHSLLCLRAIYKIMHQRDVTLPIHSFRFKFRKHSACSQDHVNQFLDLVIPRGIQNLYLDLSRDYRFKIELPSTILSCRTLKVLELTNITVRDVSHHVDLHLPNLKTLYLNRVCFGCHEDLVNLLLGCPVLEDLKVIKRSYMKDRDRLCSEEKFKALPNLIKSRICEFYIPFNMVCKAKTLRVKLSTHPQPPMFHSLPMFQCLTHLELKFIDVEWYDRRIWFLRMLKHCPKLQNLTIQVYELEEEMYEEYWMDPPTIPECLSSHLKRCCLRVFNVTKYDLIFVKVAARLSLHVGV